MVICTHTMGDGGCLRESHVPNGISTRSSLHIHNIPNVITSTCTAVGVAIDTASPSSATASPSSATFTPDDGSRKDCSCGRIPLNDGHFQRR